jgi:uncharacterized protein YciW
MTTNLPHMKILMYSNSIMYNTKPFMYQIILGINKDRLAHEIKRHDADNTFQFTVTLETVQEEFRQKFASSKKTSTPGATSELLKKKFLQRIYQRRLESKFSFQSTTNVTIWVLST